MKKNTIIVFSLIISMALSLFSCSSADFVPCREILAVLIENEIGLPAGRTYDMRAAEGDKEYLPKKLLSALYGSGEAPPIRSGWLDMALFLPASASPCEFAVILCDTPDTATDTSRLLLCRLDIIRTAKRESDRNGMLDSAAVTVIGNYVLLIISSDTENAIKAVSSLIY